MTDKPPFSIKTQDPRFDPAAPVTVNGYRYVPQERRAPAKVLPDSPAAFARHVAPRSARIVDCLATRREEDEHVCVSCSLRWSVTEDRPPCPIAIFAAGGEA